MTCFKNTKKETETLEITFREFLQPSRPARSKARALITITRSPSGHPTPPELRDRSIWRPTAVISLKFNGHPTGPRRFIPLDRLDLNRKLKVLMVYLEAQAADGVHIPQFRSTHQYYGTAKYELDRTTRDGDSPCYSTPRPTIPILIRLLAVPTMLEPVPNLWGSTDQIMSMGYLHL